MSVAIIQRLLWTIKKVQRPPFKADMATIKPQTGNKATAMIRQYRRREWIAFFIPHSIICTT
jgi:hypothetical protein